jgi:hypothetical protein
MFYDVVVPGADLATIVKQSQLVLIFDGVVRYLNAYA